MEALFELPPQDLKKLSFCKTDVESIEEWVEQLPIADMASSTRLLYSAIQEVCRLNSSAALRLQIIERLRPAIHFSCEGLKKGYLNQPVILPDKARKIANLSQALRKHLALACTIVALQSEKKMHSLLLKPSSIFNKALYFSLYEYKEILVCNYLLYRPVEDQFWLKAHSLFQLAKQHKQHGKAIKFEDVSKVQTLQNSYQELLLWGCIKANQLRQDDIRILQEYMADWASTIYLEPVKSHAQDTLFIDPATDKAPIYQKFYEGTVSLQCSQLNTADLIAELKPLADPMLQNKTKLSRNLISHLILAWSVFTDRTFMRLDSNTDLSICIGLTTAHFFLGDKKPFETLIYGKAGSPTHMQVKTGDARQANQSAKVGNSHFQRKTEEKLDAWDESLYGKKTIDKTTVTMESIDFHMRSGGTSRMTTTGNDKEKYQNHQVNVINMSPGGYCLEWNQESSSGIKAGEIIAIKGEHHNNWNIGTIRWVKQNEVKGLQLGVELISPTAKPYGAKFVALSGEDKSDFMRVLLLPEIQSAGQAASIITPSLSFKSGQHIHLMLQGKEQTILLRELQTSTGSYSQFSFEYIQSLAEQDSSVKMNPFSSDTAPNKDIDSVWELL